MGTIPRKPLGKVLVCNRGEIAIRIFRSCSEMGIRTVAVYSHEDRFSLYRYKADEAYQVGEEGTPVQSYLNIGDIVTVARRAKVDAIHPGYGFLAERADLKRAAQAHGIAFVGPSIETLEVAGDKVATRKLAEETGVPTIPGSGMLEDLAQAEAFAESCGYPIMLKAAFGGGGRGMRLVRTKEELDQAYITAQTEAQSAFGRAEMYAEKYIADPKHIEVQLLGDGTGDVIHLFERDCSLQRRHQKVIEFAPSVAVPEHQREQLFDYALTLGRKLALESATTAEFLVSDDGQIFFIEINPRIQVEHTVTEEITGIDLVQSQLRIAGGETLKDLKLAQESITVHGLAMQCRITTENPAKDFAPDHGKLLAYRSASGFGIRLDAGSAFAGAVISPFYDSMLVKVTARGDGLTSTANRMLRALSEFRIRGVITNIPFLENILRHEKFLSGEAHTGFLELHPEVFTLPRRRDRANRLLRFLADVSVNGHDSMPTLKRPEAPGEPDVPRVLITDRDVPDGYDLPAPPEGWRDKFKNMDRGSFLDAIRQEESLLITDTTFRDAHQSLLATRMRTFDMLQVADALAYNAPKLFSLEMWGGATFDVMLRFLREDPWERLSKLREAIPNILFQMLLRGSNGVGYTSYPDNVINEFIKESHSAGIDIFRIFDSLNNVDRMRMAIAGVREAGGIAEACICYTGDVLSEEKNRKQGLPVKFDLAHYVSLAEALAREGADIIAIKDMAGLLRPHAATLLIDELRSRLDLPIHLHTHDTAGVQAATLLKAAEADVDIVDCAFASMSGVTSQPCLEGMVVALQNTPRDTKLNPELLTPFSHYWETVRQYYEPFESDLRSPTAEVYVNEIPGGQYSNFRPQAASLGLGDRWSETKRAYADADKLFGGIVKVTPSSKVVGDLALFMVANNLSSAEVESRAGELDFPASVIEFLQGELGIPYGGFPEKFRNDVLRGKELLDSPPSDRLAPADLEKARSEAAKALGRKQVDVRDALSYLLYPHVFMDYAEARKNFSNLLLLPTMAYFYGLNEGEEIEVDIEPGKRLIIRLMAISEPEENGKRTVFFELNGQPRSIEIRDRRIAPEVMGNEAANPDNPGHIAAPLAGALVAIEVAEGDSITKDDTLFTLEAMKMQTAVRAPRDGIVKRVPLSLGARVDVGDLILEIE